MWYWFRPRFRGGGSCTKAGFIYGVKIFILPMALLCLALKLVLIFVYHQPVVPSTLSPVHISLMGWYLLSAPLVWWVIFRWWMRRQNRGRHGQPSRWSSPPPEPEAPGRYMTYRR